MEEESGGSSKDSEPITSTEDSGQSSMQMDESQLLDGQLMLEALSEPQKDDLQVLLQMFGDADPWHLSDLLRNGRETVSIVEEYLGAAYPRESARQERLRVERRRAQLTDPTTFDIDEFLRVFPSPEAFFTSRERAVGALYRDHALVALANEFSHMREDHLASVLDAHGGLFTPTVRDLRLSEGTARRPNTPNLRRKKKKKTTAGPVYLPEGEDRRGNQPWPDVIEESFFRELQFLQHEEAIMGRLTERQAARAAAVAAARASGSMVECVICVEEWLEEELLTCTRGKHRFCRDCVRRHAETIIGDGGHRVTCLSDDCPGEDGDDGPSEMAGVLQGGLLSDQTHQLLLRRIQDDEIRQADVPDLQSCPFCSFAMIIDNEGERLFNCRNPECLKASCRECKKPNHIPRSCQEVDEAGVCGLRTYVEEKMAEAMIRKCPKCDKRLIKSDGCNKMRCTCGSVFCYVCGVDLAVEGYGHFNQTGHPFGLGGRMPAEGTPEWAAMPEHMREVVARARAAEEAGRVAAEAGRAAGRCPMYSSNDEMHSKAAKEAGEAAKAEYFQRHPEVRQELDEDEKKKEKAPDVDKLVDKADDARDDRYQRMLLAARARGRGRMFRGDDLEHHRLDIFLGGGQRAPWHRRVAAEGAAPGPDPRPRLRQITALIQRSVEEMLERPGNGGAQPAQRRLDELMRLDEEVQNQTATAEDWEGLDPAQRTAIANRATRLHIQVRRIRTDMALEDNAYGDDNDEIDDMDGILAEMLPFYSDRAMGFGGHHRPMMGLFRAGYNDEMQAQADAALERRRTTCQQQLDQVRREIIHGDELETRARLRLEHFRPTGDEVGDRMQTHILRVNVDQVAETRRRLNERLAVLQRQMNALPAPRECGRPARRAARELPAPEELRAQIPAPFDMVEDLERVRAEMRERGERLRQQRERRQVFDQLPRSRSSSPEPEREPEHEPEPKPESKPSRTLKDDAPLTDSSVSDDEVAQTSSRLTTAGKLSMRLSSLFAQPEPAESLTARMNTGGAWKKAEDSTVKKKKKVAALKVSSSQQDSGETSVPTTTPPGQLTQLRAEVARLSAALTQRQRDSASPAEMRDLMGRRDAAIRRLHSEEAKLLAAGMAETDVRSPAAPIGEEELAEDVAEAQRLTVQAQGERQQLLATATTAQPIADARNPGYLAAGHAEMRRRYRIAMLGERGLVDRDLRLQPELDMTMPPRHRIRRGPGPGDEMRGREDALLARLAQEIRRQDQEGDQPRSDLLQRLRVLVKGYPLQPIQRAQVLVEAGQIAAENDGVLPRELLRRLGNAATADDLVGVVTTLLGLLLYRRRTPARRPAGPRLDVQPLIDGLARLTHWTQDDPQWATIQAARRLVPALLHNQDDPMPQLVEVVDLFFSDRGNDNFEREKMIALMEARRNGSPQQLVREIATQLQRVASRSVRARPRPNIDLQPLVEATRRLRAANPLPQHVRDMLALIRPVLDRHQNPGTNNLLIDELLILAGQIRTQMRTNDIAYAPYQALHEADAQGVVRVLADYLTQQKQVAIREYGRRPGPPPPWAMGQYIACVTAREAVKKEATGSVKKEMCSCDSCEDCVTRRRAGSFQASLSRTASFLERTNAETQREIEALELDGARRRPRKRAQASSAAASSSASKTMPPKEKEPVEESSVVIEDEPPTPPERTPRSPEKAAVGGGACLLKRLNSPASGSRKPGRLRRGKRMSSIRKSLEGHAGDCGNCSLTEAHAHDDEESEDEETPPDETPTEDTELQRLRQLRAAATQDLARRRAQRQAMEASNREVEVGRQRSEALVAGRRRDWEAFQQRLAMLHRQRVELDATIRATEADVDGRHVLYQQGQHELDVVSARAQQARDEMPRLALSTSEAEQRLRVLETQLASYLERGQARPAPGDETETPKEEAEEPQRVAVEEIANHLDVEIPQDLGALVKQFLTLGKESEIRQILQNKLKGKEPIPVVQLDSEDSETDGVEIIGEKMADEAGPSGEATLRAESTDEGDDDTFATAMRRIQGNEDERRTRPTRSESFPPNIVNRILDPALSADFGGEDAPAARSSTSRSHSIDSSRPEQMAELRSPDTPRSIHVALSPCDHLPSQGPKVEVDNGAGNLDEEGGEMRSIQINIHMPGNTRRRPPPVQPNAAESRGAEARAAAPHDEDGMEMDFE